MATVLPFPGMRPRQDIAERVAAPPYDVVSSLEARELAAGNPYSFLHISKPEIDLAPDVDVHSDAVYEQGARNIARFIDEGLFTQDPQPAFYLYRQTLGGHSQTGIVCLVSADEYESGVIRKHELTRPQKEDDRVRHMQAVQAQTGPVFLTYRSENELTALMERGAAQEPVNDFVSDNVRHQFWVIDDAGLQREISSHFDAVPMLFVADGHHRSAAAVRYRAWRRDNNPGHTGREAYNYFMAVLFPHDQLNILGYHRVLTDLGDRTQEDFLEALGNDFAVSECSGDPVPDAPGGFGLYLGGKWRHLQFRGNVSAKDPVAALDMSILQDCVLGPLLGIKDQRTDDRVDFIGGIRGLPALEKAVDSGKFAAAIACYPVDIEQLMAVAEQDKLMPPKSTWFEPKLKSGLVIHYLGETVHG